MLRLMARLIGAAGIASPFDAPACRFMPSVLNMVASFGRARRGRRRLDHFGAVRLFARCDRLAQSTLDAPAWLADVLARITDPPAQKLDELLPWNFGRR